MAQNNFRNVVNPRGQAGVTTSVEVVNQVVGQNQLIISFDNSGGGATAFAPWLFPGCWMLGPLAWAAAGTNLPATCSFASASGHATYEQMIYYFNNIFTNIAGCRIETSDIDNFNQGAFFQFSEKQPDGTLATPVKRFISTYRQPLGSDWAKSMDISPKDLAFILWAGQSVKLPIIKAGTSMTYYFNVYGWNKMKNLMPLKNNEIG